MRRKLSTALALGSFVFFLGSVALWARSHAQVGDEIWRAWNTADPPAYGYDSIACTDGVLALTVCRARFHDPIWDVPMARARSNDPMLQRFWRYRGIAKHLYIVTKVETYTIAGWRRRLAQRGFWFDWESAERHGEGREPRPTGFGLDVGVPIWFLAAVFAVLPVKRAAQFIRRRRRRRRGLCPMCGYDLRATPDRCPECGAVPGGVSATAA